MGLKILLPWMLHSCVVSSVVCGGVWREGGREGESFVVCDEWREGGGWGRGVYVRREG